MTAFMIAFDAEQPVICLESFFAQQLKLWPEFRESVADLKQVQEKAFVYKEGCPLRVRCMPKRKTSTTAEPSRKKGSRLVLDQLPQKQIQLDLNPLLPFYVLCNPFPIFSNHFVIASYPEQKKQQILGNEMDIQALIGLFGEDYLLMYNGALCGASESKHLHFHLIPKKELLAEYSYTQQLSTVVENSNTYLAHPCCWVYHISSSEEAVPKTLPQLLDRLKSDPRNWGTDEFPINVVMWKDKGRYHYLLYLRKKHRPSTYPEPWMISPGVVDMFGCLITPDEKSFESLTKAEDLAFILSDVSYTGSE